MRLPRLAKHTGIYVIVPVIQRAAYFALIPVFTHILAPAEYGAWGYVIVAATLLGTLAPFGLLTTYTYALRRPDDWQASAEQIRRAALQTAVVFVGCANIAAFFALRRIDLGVDRADLLWSTVLLATLLGSMEQVAKRRYQMLERPWRYAAIELTTGLVVAAASLVAVVVLHWGVLGLAWGLCAGAAAGLGLSLHSIWPDLWGRVDARARAAALRFGLPLFVHTAAAVVLQYVDRFMLERQSSLEQLGLYSLAGQIGTAMLVITMSTNQAYLPFLYRHATSRPVLIKRGERYVALFFTVVGLAGVALVAPFISYLIDPRYGAARLPAQILLVSGILHGFYYLMVGRLLVVRRTVSIAVVTAFATLVNVALNYYWIPRWHATGAAWATLVSEFVLFSVMWYVSRHTVSLHPQDRAVETLEAGS
jgi:O-antigen/teichoic acid export membrane protein